MDSATSGPMYGTLPPPPSYDFSQQDFDQKTAAAIQASQASTAKNQPNAHQQHVDDDFEQWDDAKFQAAAAAYAARLAKRNAGAGGGEGAGHRNHAESVSTTMTTSSRAGSPSQMSRPTHAGTSRTQSPIADTFSTVQYMGATDTLNQAMNDMALNNTSSRPSSYQLAPISPISPIQAPVQAPSPAPPAPPRSPPAVVEPEQRSGANLSRYPSLFTTRIPEGEALPAFTPFAPPGHHLPAGDGISAASPIVVQPNEQSTAPIAPPPARPRPRVSTTAPRPGGMYTGQPHPLPRPSSSVSSPTSPQRQSSFVPPPPPPPIQNRNSGAPPVSVPLMANTTTYSSFPPGSVDEPPAFSSSRPFAFPSEKLDAYLKGKESTRPSTLYSSGNSNDVFVAPTINFDPQKALNSWRNQHEETRSPTVGSKVDNPAGFYSAAISNIVAKRPLPSPGGPRALPGTNSNNNWNNGRQLPKPGPTATLTTQYNYDHTLTAQSATYQNNSTQTQYYAQTQTAAVDPNAYYTRTVYAAAESQAPPPAQGYGYSQQQQQRQQQLPQPDSGAYSVPQWTLTANPAGHGAGPPNGYAAPAGNYMSNWGGNAAADYYRH